MIKIHSSNEWDRLRSIVVGTATGACWMDEDPVWQREREKTTWKESDPPKGAVPQWIIDETNEDLERLCDILRQARVEVLRPLDIDYAGVGGMYGYCPRDRLLIAGDRVVDMCMMYPGRNNEIVAYEHIRDLCDHDRWVTMPRDQGMICDAANICRLDDTWLFLESSSGNRLALHWLQQQFPNINIELCNFYAGVHIDSTVVPLCEGLVMLNASRVRPESVPHCLATWEKIWVEDIVAQDFYQYPYASEWIGMNTLSIDESTVIVDAAQIDLIKCLENRGLVVIPLILRHSRTLGGGFHCVTLDLVRG